MQQHIILILLNDVDDDDVEYLSEEWLDFVSFITPCSAGVVAREAGLVIPFKLADDSPLTAAIIRRRMKFWSCPYSRASCPSNKKIMMNAMRYSSLCNRAISVDTPPNKSLKNATAPDEIVHGLTAKSFLKIFLNDHRIYTLIDDDDKRVSGLIYNTMHAFGLNQLVGLFSRLRSEDRAEFIADHNALGR